MKFATECIDAIGPWGRGADTLADWLTRPGAPWNPAVAKIPNVEGFMRSPFLNFTYATQTECLKRATADDGSAPVGIILASVLGDTVTADKASIAVAKGAVPMPLLFYQSVPSAVLGRITADMGVGGPLICLSGGVSLFADALEVAELLLDDYLHQVLITYVDAGDGRWRQASADALARLWGEPVVPEWDCAVSVLVRTAHDEPDIHGYPISANGDPDDRLQTLPRPLRDFARLALARPSARMQRLVPPAPHPDQSRQL